jgi:hypothetical protein
LDDFNESVVRRTINGFYIVENQRPALKKVGGDSDDSSDDSCDSSGGDKEAQACGDDIYADIAGVAPLE